MRKKFFLFFLLTTVSFVLFPQTPQGISFVRTGESLASSDSYVLSAQEQLTGQAFQQDALLTYKGYQYTVYYNGTRNVCIARRKLPSGDWKEIVLNHKNTADDAHNVISMGICANDGTIHLSYDHHNTTLHYRRSAIGLANETQSMKWSASNFGQDISQMVDGVTVPDVTYPRFISKPDGNLLFECRYKLSGDGDSYLREYNGNTHKWSLIGRYVQGMDYTPNACAYINRMDYDTNGRLHVSWCWRDDFGGGSNHDISYAYSDDHGRSWKDTNGTQVATTENINPTDSRNSGACLRQGIGSLKVAIIPYNKGYINQESQATDSKGRIHILNSYMTDGTDSNWTTSRTKAVLHHRFRDSDGNWKVNIVKKNGVNVNSYCRSQIVIDAFDNAYVIANGAEVYAATSASGYADWGLISDMDKNRFCSEPQVDHPRLLNEGLLSFVYLGRDKKVVVIDYLLNNPHQPDGTGLNKKNENGLNIWSGTLETLFGEQYTLHLNTNAPTSIFVDGKLLIEKVSATQQEISAVVPLIGSHKHNIEIRTQSTENIENFLSWSSAHTTKAAIPQQSLFSALQMQDDSNNGYPYSPDLPESQNFGCVNIVDLDYFTPSLSDFTLEIQATGAPILIGNGYINYVPANSGIVRFAQKGDKIYVYENGNYKTTLTPNVSMNFPDILSAANNSSAKTGIYDERNLFLNPGFETVASYISGYDPVTRPADTRSKAADWYTLDSYYGSGSRANNLTVNSGYASMRSLAEGDCAFMLHGYGAGNEGMSLWQKLEGMLPNTAYKVSFRHLSHKDTSPAGAGYTVRLGGYFSNYFAEYNYTSPTEGFGNYKDVSFSFVTPANLPASVYFFISRTSTCIAHFDRMSLVEGTVHAGKGISGATSAIFLEGIAYAPVIPTSLGKKKMSELIDVWTSGDKLYVQVPDKNSSIRIYDIMGKIIVYTESENHIFSTRLDSGMYIVVVNSRVLNQTYTRKIVL